MTHTVATVLLLCAIVLLILRFLLFVGVHFYHREQQPAFTPWKTTLSEYGTGEGRPVFTAMGMITLLAYALITFCLTTFGLITLPWQIVAWCGIISQFLLFLFPTDIIDTGHRSRSGIAHAIFAVTGFVFFYVFVTFVPLTTMWENSIWLLIWRIFTHIGLWSFLVSSTVPYLRSHILGLTERIYLIAVPLWFLTVAVHMLIG